MDDDLIHKSEIAEYLTVISDNKITLTSTASTSSIWLMAVVKPEEKDAIKALLFLLGIASEESISSQCLWLNTSNLCTAIHRYRSSKKSSNTS